MRASWAGLIGAVAIILSAQSAAAMSLREAVHHTVHTNPEVGAARAERRANAYALLQSQGRLLPEVDVSADIGAERIDRPQGFAAGVNDEWRNRRQGTLTVRQILFDGWERANDIYRGAARLDASALRVLETSDLLALTAVEAYIDVRRHQELLGIARENLQRHLQFLDLVEARREGGKAPASEVDQTLERVAAAEAVVAEIRQAWLEANAKFRRVVGLDAEGIGRVGLPSQMPTSLNQAVDVALRANPGIRATDADIDAAQFEQAQAESAYMPELSLQGSASIGEDLAGTPGRNDTLVGQLVLSWNLFNGFQTTNRYRELGERAEQARLLRQVRLREVGETIERAWASYTVGRERVGLFEQQVAKNVQVVDAYKQEYELSKRSLLDLLDSESALFNSRFQLISVRAVRTFAAYQMLASMGRILVSLNVDAPPEGVANHREQGQRPFGVFNIEIEPLGK